MKVIVAFLMFVLLGCSSDNQEVENQSISNTPKPTLNDESARPPQIPSI